MNSSEFDESETVALHLRGKLPGDSIRCNTRN